MVLYRLRKRILWRPTERECQVSHPEVKLPNLVVMAVFELDSMLAVVAPSEETPTTAEEQHPSVYHKLYKTICKSHKPS